MKNTLIILLLGIALGISSTALVNYISNHSWNTWEHIISLDNGQIIQNIKSKINPAKYDKFEEVYQVLSKQYYQTSGKTLDETMMIESALHGFVDGLQDPHSAYFDIQESSWLNQVLAGDQKFEWIGAVVSRRPDGVQIMEVLKWSPAQIAWLKPLDLVIQVNEQDIEGMTVAQAVKLIRWPAGTTVDLTIFRSSEQKVLTITVTRDKIDVPSVSRNILTQTGSDIKLWYVAISIFGEDTYMKFRDALDAISQESVAGYIIDVRGNGGGFLPTAVDIASHFIPKSNTIATTRYKTFPEEVYKSDWREWADRLLPVVVLIDEYSASASEVLALALKQNIDAKLIGEQTFGKWSIQTIYDFDDGSSLKYTIGRRYAPDNTNVDHVGITPDIEVIFDGTGYQKQWIDNQLQSAIDQLTK
jgi:carboxyl-terminal processing protease